MRYVNYLKVIILQFLILTKICNMKLLLIHCIYMLKVFIFVKKKKPWKIMKNIVSLHQIVLKVLSAENQVY